MAGVEGDVLGFWIDVQIGAPSTLRAVAAHDFMVCEGGDFDGEGHGAAVAFCSIRGELLGW
jgi:hypothetical protein